jgi:hypothetical protein
MPVSKRLYKTDPAGNPPLGPSTSRRDGGKLTGHIGVGDLRTGGGGALGESAGVAAPTPGAATVTNGTDEVQTIDRGGATGGTFRVGYHGWYTPSLAYNASAATVQAAIRAITCPDQDLSAVTVTAGVGDDLVVKFVGTGKPMDALQVVDSTTGGTGVVVTETTPGARGSVSVAYTEASGGDSILATVEHATTGKTFGGKVVDAATPVAFTDLEPGSYICVMRTIATDGRISSYATVAFTVASA